MLKAVAHDQAEKARTNHLTIFLHSVTTSLHLVISTSDGRDTAIGWFIPLPPTSSEPSPTRANARVVSRRILALYVLAHYDRR